MACQPTMESDMFILSAHEGLSFLFHPFGLIWAVVSQLSSYGPNGLLAHHNMVQWLGKRPKDDGYNLD
jgi:hypothetical protein